MLQPWWQAVTPHEDIREGRVNEALFDARLGRAALGEGSVEYRDTRVFFQKTCFTDGLNDLLTQVLRRVAGEGDQNGVLWLQTGFGGGKSHSELAAYHLLKRPEEAMSVPEVSELVRKAGLERPPRARVAVISGTSLNPLGRTSSDDIRIRTLWGEVAYQLGGAEAYAVVAENDARLLSPGDETLIQLLRHVGPCAILFDETLHYVDKVATGEEGTKSLAGQAVAFLRELTDAVNTVPGAVMVVSLTASREDMLSDGAVAWLERLNEHVLREATPVRPVQRGEIHEVVRRRLFEAVDAEAATAAATAYRQFYDGLKGLPDDKIGNEYQHLLSRSYPFHPELISVLYERWGTRQGFQETRDTLRFLAWTLAHLWARREELQGMFVHCCDVDLGVGDLRGMARRVAADEQWESVIGTDIAAEPGAEPAKAQLLDREYETGRRAEGLATAILFYSIGGGESPHATREELRLACSQPGVDESLWEDILARLGRRLFYYYCEESRHEFRKEPNVLSLQSTHYTNLQPKEVEDHIHSVAKEKVLGDKMPGHAFQVYVRPEDAQEVADDESLKLLVLDTQFTVTDGVPHDDTTRTCLNILQSRGDVLRQNRNTLLFCAADAQDIQQAREAAREYLSWSKIQGTSNEWERIGGFQQERVRTSMENASAATIKAIAGAYSWVLIPAAPRQGGSELAISPLRIGLYGPGKLIVPMVWEHLTSSEGAGPTILTELTPEVLLDRYQEHCWPKAHLSVTTRELWERFCRQVALPMLEEQNVLLDTVEMGQRKGLFAVGHLLDDNSPRDQRDSYTALYLGQAALPPNELPQIGQRWVLLRPSLYEEIVKLPTKVTVEEVREAVRAVDGNGQAARVSAVYAYIEKGREAGIDGDSFVSAVKELADKRELVYQVERGGPVGLPPAELEELRNGWVFEPEAPPLPGPPQGGRSISVQGSLEGLKNFGALVKNILQPLDSQKPKRFRIAVDVTAEWDDDPGSGLTAALEDGKNDPALKGIVTVKDSREP